MKYYSNSFKNKEIGGVRKSKGIQRDKTVGCLGLITASFYMYVYCIAPKITSLISVNLSHWLDQ